MVISIQFFPIKAYYLLTSSDHYFITFLASNSDFLSSFTCKQIAKESGKIVL